MPRRRRRGGLHCGGCSSPSCPTRPQQVRQLENELGLTLLARTTRRVELTADGTAFCRMPDRTLSPRGVGQAAEELRVGTWSAGSFVDSTAYELVPTFLRSFRPPGRKPSRNSTRSPPTSKPERWSTVRSTSALAERFRGQLSMPRCSGTLFIAGAGRPSSPWQRTVTLRRLAAEPFVGFSRSTSPSLRRSRAPGRAWGRVRPCARGHRVPTIVGLVAAGRVLVPAGVHRLQLPEIAYVKVADTDACARSSASTRRADGRRQRH